jgi:hypothetical protein
MQSPGIETVPSGNMRRRKREGKHSVPKNKVVQDLGKMKKMDTQIQTPTKQR